MSHKIRCAAVLGCLVFAGCSRNATFAQSDEQYWRQAAAENPADVKSQVMFGIELLGSGKLNDAKQVLLAAEKIAPKDASCHEILGDVSLKLGERPKAKTEWLMAMKTATGEVFRLDIESRLKSLGEGV